MTHFKKNLDVGFALVCSLQVLTVGNFACASSLPPATYVQAADSNRVTIPGAFSFRDGSGFGSISIDASSNSLSVDAHDDNSLNYPYSESATFQYYFRVTGPVDGLVIPIDIYLAITTLGTGIYYSSARFLGPTTYDEIDQCDQTIGAPGCQTYGQVSYIVHETLQSGASYAITLSVSSNVYRYLSSGSAAIDPYLVVDPSFSNASLYSIEFSSGVQNGVAPSTAGDTPIDEPSTVLLLLSFVGLLRAFRPDRQNSPTPRNT